MRNAAYQNKNIVYYCPQVFKASTFKSLSRATMNSK